MDNWFGHLLLTWPDSPSVPVAVQPLLPPSRGPARPVHPCLCTAHLLLAADLQLCDLRYSQWLPVVHAQERALAAKRTSHGTN
jgi:hypothetical protein